MLLHSKRARGEYASTPLALLLLLLLR